MLGDSDSEPTAGDVERHASVSNLKSASGPCQLTRAQGRVPRADDISVVHYVRLEEAECAETEYVTALLGISSTTLGHGGSNDSKQPMRAGYAAALSSK